MNIITRQWLIEQAACTSQLKIFSAEWPEGASLTLLNINRAASLHLNIDWFAAHFLPAPAWKAYEKSKATALKAELERIWKL